MVGIPLNHTEVRSLTRGGARGRLFGQLGCSKHERRVASIAVRMFDLLSTEHGLGARHRGLLRIAGLVHDAAKRYGAADHHIRGARFVMRDRSLRLTARARRAVAYLVRYHRGDVDDVDGVLRPGDGRRKMRLLLALLRAADALDGRNLSAASIVIRKKGRKLKIECRVDGNVDRARDRFARRSKFKLLQETLGLRAQVRVRAALTPLH